MNDNFLVVLFKDKVKKKIINKFITQKKAEDYYKKLIYQSDDVIFSKEYENGHKCFFEVGLLGKNIKSEVKYQKDELGRQIKIELEDEDYSILKIQRYYIEETIVEYKTKKKITSKDLIKNYLSGSGIKMISKLNNKIIVQVDDVFNLFTLKNQYDSDRFMDSLNELFIKEKRTDCLLVKDVSTPQRKYLYEILVGLGFNKKYLLRHSTAHPI